MAASDIELERGLPLATDVPGWLKGYVFLALFLLPMDWFEPTGELFREFGAKPAVLLLVAGGIGGLCLLTHLRTERGSYEFKALIFFAAWLALGFGAGLLNFVLGWSPWDFLHNPMTQLANQGAMVVVCAIAVIGNSRIMRAYPVAELAARYLPAVVLLHMGVFALEALRLISHSTGPLALFRVELKGEFDRPSGFFSEPSYFGTFVATYGTALFCLPAGPVKRLWMSMLTLAMYFSAVLLGAKTVVVVAGTQAVYFLLRRTQSVAVRITSIVMMLAVAGVLIFFMQSYAVFDVEENLSSADRLGSALLAANVAREGYSLPGIGFGQFHFLYRPEFAPDFLFLSKEASTLLTSQGVNRASTYDFYLRVLLETGVLGFILLVAALRKLWFADLPRSMTYVSVMFAGALGFLVTQDPYFYPPLVFTSALILAALDTKAAGTPTRVIQNG